MSIDRLTAQGNRTRSRIPLLAIRSQKRWTGFDPDQIWHRPPLTWRKAVRLVLGQNARASMRFVPLRGEARRQRHWLVLQHPGAPDERKSVHLHINFGLLAGILRELARSVAALPKDDIAHREQLAEALDELRRALGAK